jgi:molybdopterin molybdotransferase
VIGFEDALALLRQVAIPLGREMVGLGSARHRVLAAPLLARVDSPRRDVSAMDGYAVREEDLASLPVRLEIIGHSFAGQADLPGLSPGTCARIFTGGALPPGADRVIVQEVVRTEGQWAVFETQLSKARHVRTRASDFAAGEILLPPGHRLSARSLVTAAAADRSRVDVWRMPLVAIVGTGDELAEPGCAHLDSASIPESLSWGVAGLVRDWGGQVVDTLRVRDDPAMLDEAAARALAAADLVVVTGGASVGEKDFAKAMFRPFGLDLLFSKVAIKPGKPVWLGRAAGKLVLGLPGNPTSAMVTARLILAPLLAGLGGMDPICALQWRSLPLSRPLGPCGDRETFYRARRTDDGVEPLFDQDSGAQKALAEADLLLRRSAGAPAVEVGDLVEVLDF